MMIDASAPASFWHGVRDGRWSATALGALAGLVLSIPLLAYDFWFDQGVFATLADSLLNGGLAYRDAWEHKPPGILFTYAAAFLLCGRELASVRSLEILAMAATSAGLVELGRRQLGSRVAGLIAALLFPLLYLSFAPNTAQPESFQLPLLVWGLSLWPTDLGERRARGKSFGCGLLLAFAILFKTPAAVIVAPVIFFRLWMDRRESGVARQLALSGFVLAGLLLPWLALLGNYAVRGAFEPLWDALVIFPAQYASAAPRHEIGTHFREAGSWIRGLLSPGEIGLALVGAGAACRRPGALLCLVSVGTAWAGVAAQSRYFHYHWIPLLPFLCFALGAAVAMPPAFRVESRGRFWACWVLVGFLAAASLPAIGLRLIRMGPAFGRVATLQRSVALPGVATPWSESRSVAAAIRERTQPGERIFVWGDEALLYLYADRRMAGPYPHLMAVLSEWRGKTGLVRLLQQFEDVPPALIVVGSGKLWWRQGLDPRQLMEIFPDMKNLLADRYHRIDGPPGFDFWRLGN